MPVIFRMQLFFAKLMDYFFERWRSGLWFVGFWVLLTGECFGWMMDEGGIGVFFTFCGAGLWIGHET